MVYKVDGNPQLDSRDWSMYSNILNACNWSISHKNFSLVISQRPGGILVISQSIKVDLVS